jgi:DNA repair protein RecN (Recombination protein N)
MLQEIYINNFILIDELRLEFLPGMNVLSGETGAGKSIVVDALGLVMGDRINQDYARDAGRQVLVEAVFDVSNNTEARIFLWEQGLMGEEEDADTIILSREVNPHGKTAGRINGRQVTAATLKILSTFLLDMHLQNDRQNILRPANYLDYVDSFAGDIEELLMRVGELHTLLMVRRKQLEDFRLNQHNRVQNLDFLAYQIKEIEAGGLRNGEEEELKQLRDRIKNAGKLLEGSNRILGLLYSSEAGASAYDKMATALDITRDCRNDSFFAGLLEPMENIYYSLQDLTGSLSAFREDLEFEPGLLEETEDRLYHISKLKNKYGATIEDILNYLDQARTEWQELEQGEERQDEIQKEIERLYAQYMHLATELSCQRQTAALLLEAKVQSELLDLNMPLIDFAVTINSRNEPGLRGIDEVDFLFSSNPGEEMKPVMRIASGGEISRFILALKAALADVYHIPTLIFDEIDVGLGGSALSSVARKLAELSRIHQLILVTHAPQVASYGNRNFVIAKQVDEERTFTRVKSVDKDEKVMEIARMLGGENYSDLTLEHAREMIALAQKYHQN